MPVRRRSRVGGWGWAVYVQVMSGRRTLSGGERFQAGLALALALVEIAARGGR